MSIASGEKGMVRVHGGSFRMGSTDFYPEERPVRTARVDPLWMDQHPVTVREFRRFVRDTGHVTVAETAPEAEEFPDADPSQLVPGLEFIVLAPIFEEVAFRGVLFGTLRKKFSWGWSAVLSAGIFALAHGYGVLGFVAVFWSGALWALSYEKTGSLWPGIIAHCAGNLMATAGVIALLRL